MLRQNNQAIVIPSHHLRSNFAAWTGQVDGRPVGVVNMTAAVDEVLYRQARSAFVEAGIHPDLVDGVLYGVRGGPVAQEQADT